MSYHAMRIPTATYRIQFNASFGFREALRIIPYLFRLGMSDVYASPIFKARAGSPHGYDVTDPNRINAEVGTRADFRALGEALARRDMGWVQDCVPNHMAYDTENHLLMDVLEKGPASPFFSFFDVEWDHPSETLQRKLLAPFLGKPYEETLAAGEISLQYGEEGLHVRYYDLAFPLRAESYAGILGRRREVLEERLGEKHPDFLQFLGVLDALRSSSPSRSAKGRRHPSTPGVKQFLRDLVRANPLVHEFVQENVDLFNRDLDSLDALLTQQRFWLTFWKFATKEINYRRFFHINGLISVRVEEEHVFRTVHQLIFELWQNGSITGLRIDHIDGLYDPATYLTRLREQTKDAYIVVEKILDMEEELPAEWPIQGTTGYDFLNYVNGIFCDRIHRDAFRHIYVDFTETPYSYEDLMHEEKKLMLERHMTGDLDNLARLLKKASATVRSGRDLTQNDLEEALAETLASFPVYRTYIRDGHVGDQDRRVIRKAIEAARATRPDLRRELGFLETVLLLNFPASLPEGGHRTWLAFVMRFQQFTGPLMAKGLEDTVFYVFNKFISLNNVGGDPNRFGVSVDAFHAFCRKRAEQWPHTMNTLSTHDSKRGEDVRARINVLSEMPEEWEQTIHLWHQQNRSKKKQVKGKEAPDKNEEYFLYQTLTGAFPLETDETDDFVRRIQDYMIKAVREAKVNTSWLDPDIEYEEALNDFIESILRASSPNPFLDVFLPFQRKIAHFGVFNSLSQTLLKMTAPGVPDCYQGGELWDLNLVDPDNRRPVDFARRETLLFGLQEQEKRELLPLIRELLATKEDARIKLFTIYRALQARKALKDVFDGGNYLPLTLIGTHRSHAVAFARKKGKEAVVVVAPRLLSCMIGPGQLPLGREVWKDTAMEMPDDLPRRWRHVFTEQVAKSDNVLALAEVFRHFPLGFLVGEASC